MPQHVLTGEELNPKQINHLFKLALLLKKERAKNKLRNDLIGRQLALLFSKASLRTRFSFTVAMRELGGNVVESIEGTRKEEVPEDFARVLGGYCHAIMVRTHKDTVLKRMSNVSTVPIINGLSDLHHPCQIYADLMTLLEVYQSLAGLTLTYIGDGNNILISLFEIRSTIIGKCNRDDLNCIYSTLNNYSHCGNQKLAQI